MMTMGCEDGGDDYNRRYDTVLVKINYRDRDQACWYAISRIMHCVTHLMTVYLSCHAVRHFDMLDNCVYVGLRGT